MATLPTRTSIRCNADKKHAVTHLGDGLKQQSRHSLVSKAGNRNDLSYTDAFQVWTHPKPARNNISQKALSKHAHTIIFKIFCNALCSNL
jgi:hypothetical protein